MLHILFIEDFAFLWCQIKIVVYEYIEYKYGPRKPHVCFNFNISYNINFPSTFL